MRALVLKEYNRFSVEDVPAPEIGPREVLVRVRACGICGSDVHGMDGSTGRRIPPIIMGHEASGTVEKLGSEVSGWSLGAAVTFDSMISCGACEFCRAGAINLCDQRRVFGVSCEEFRQDGAYAEFVAVPEHILYRIPEGLSFDHAAMIEPISVAFHAVERVPLALNDTVVVVGSGMIGLLVIQALRLKGCGRIIAVDLDAHKLELARQLGADEGLKADEIDVVEEVRARTRGHGADASFEVVGLSPTVQTAVNCLKKGGALALVGNLAASVELPLQVVVTRELTLYGSCASAGEYPACLDMLQRGAIQVEPFISGRIPLDDAAAWFRRLHDGEPGLMKVIVEP